MHKILLQPLSVLRGVGTVIHKSLLRLTIRDRIFDLLLIKPLRIENISFCPRLFEVQNDELIIIKAKIESHVKPANSRQPHKIICYTPTGYFSLVFFKTFPGQIEKLKIGREIAVLGNLQKSSGENQIVHPQEIIDAKDIEKLPKINVIYPLSYAITQKFLRNKIKEILILCEKEKPLEEWIDVSLIKQKNWNGFFEAMKNLHYFETSFFKDDSRKRLAYDEFLAWSIAILLAKKQGVQNKTKINFTKNLADEFLTSLPFELTKSQHKVMLEIKNDIASSKKMLRLLQGDVGSGKTVVAIFACLLAISQNKQACVIVPITTLAKQHFIYFQKLLEGLNINVELLIGTTTKKQKNKILQDLSEGKIDILISTHAVLEDDVKFKNLGLAIIDEQHRFGVMQRLKLVEKGQEVDTLLMSATPIPRSLMMGLYGDMDISILNEKPKNRQKIETLIMSSNKSDEIYESLKRAIAQGEKIYFICPAIEEEIIDENNLEKEANGLRSVKEKHQELVKIFGQEKTGLLHGKMKESEKEKVMSEFVKSDGCLKILVATTVIEVGIDVSDATIIVIENAEHFGLSQLHQLRGRVGRGEKKSYCILLYGKKYGANGKKRLGILRDSNDGFFIAEEDLKMRGSGELLGTKQSGFPEFKIADLNFDNDLLKIAHKNAEVILQKDEKLQFPESKKYRELLQLFNYDECLKMVSGG
ncbi:MAG: ATP-dependent DNA helicase RecG [Rickettsiales bacterium]|nr:ATP-dependent DNA helicase RecG [Rickettsiales bacterium]